MLKTLTFSVFITIVTLIILASNAHADEAYIYLGPSNADAACRREADPNGTWKKIYNGTFSYNHGWSVKCHGLDEVNNRSYYLVYGICRSTYGEDSFILEKDPAGCYRERKKEDPPEEKDCSKAPPEYGDKNNYIEADSLDPTQTLCLDGCMYFPSESYCMDGKAPCFFVGPWWSIKTACTGGSGGSNPNGEGENGTEDIKPNMCEAGTCPGTVNGVSVCVPCTNMGKPKPPGGGEGNGGGEGGGEGAGGGEGGGEGTGGGEGGGTGGGGGSGGTGEGGEGEDDKGSSWGGTCKQGFTCEGDALICAISRAEYERNCSLLEETKESDEAKVYADAAAAGVGGSQIDKLTTTVNINSGMIDTSSALGGGSCIADLPIVIGGRTHVLPLSKLCIYLQGLGYLLVSISMLLAGRIILRG